jgi:hypothetical protein
MADSQSFRHVYKDCLNVRGYEADLGDVVVGTQIDYICLYSSFLKQCSLLQMPLDSDDFVEHSLITGNSQM